MKFKSALSLCLLFLVGCTPSPVIPVSGKITFADRDVPEVCRLSFLPTESTEGVSIRPSGGEMSADGTYELAPFQGVKGLLPGTYKIRINYFDLKRNGDPDREGDWKETSFDAGELVIEAGSGPVTHDIEVK